MVEIKLDHLAEEEGNTIDFVPVADLDDSTYLILLNRIRENVERPASAHHLFADAAATILLSITRRASAPSPAGNVRDLNSAQRFLLKEKSKQLFFDKEKLSLPSHLQHHCSATCGRNASTANRPKVFWSFFSKKDCLLAVTLINRLKTPNMPKIFPYALLLILVITATLYTLYTPDKPRAALTAKYAQPPSTFQTIAGITLHLRDTGPKSAPTIIFLHGFGASLQTWDDWAQNLQTDHRVVRYDLPGFGLTGPDPTKDYTDTRSIAVLLALMDRLGIAQATIAGHSMGGRIAFTFAALHPERVTKLILISPDGFASPGLTTGQPPTVPLLMRALPYALPSFMLRATLAAAYANPRILTQTLFTRYRDMMLAPGIRRAILQRMAQQIQTDPIPVLNRIQSPTLIMWGEKDAMIPFTNAADYLRALPHATLAALPATGHIPQEESPATISILRQFLDH